MKIGYNTKLIILCSLFAISYWWLIFAHDCDLVATTKDISQSPGYTWFIQNINGLNYQAVFPPDALAKALENLKKDCCQESILDSTYCVGYTDSIDYPQSPFLYDQLIDVGFRRLDGNSALTYGLAPDPLGKTRRDFITQAAASGTGMTARAVMTGYQKYRSRKAFLSRIDADENQTIFSNFILNYNSPANVTLADKYYNLCQVMKDIYDKKIGGKTIGEYNNSYYKSCQKLATKRINDEYTKTKTIMIEKSNALLHQTTLAYTQGYFIEDRMMTLITTINNIKSLFSTMVQQAAASQSCSK